jgi:hypothetical protein
MNRIMHIEDGFFADGVRNPSCIAGFFDPGARSAGCGDGQSRCAVTLLRSGI